MFIVLTFGLLCVYFVCCVLMSHYMSPKYLLRPHYKCLALYKGLAGSDILLLGQKQTNKESAEQPCFCIEANNHLVFLELCVCVSVCLCVCVVATPGRRWLGFSNQTLRQGCSATVLLRAAHSKKGNHTGT